MKPTRRSQPYRRGARQPTDALAAMLRGRTAAGWNPADTQRQAAKLTGWPKLGRAPRPPRGRRASRSPR